jgi:hypothetical protein
MKIYFKIQIIYCNFYRVFQKLNVNKIMRSLCSILFILFLFSCKEQHGTLITFDPRSNGAKSEISLSEIADEIKYIPLDNSFPLGIIYNYRITKKSIYLSSKDIGVLKYNRDGKFERKIGSIGRGPGEYHYCYDFTVDDDRETIYVEDNGILKAYSKSGNFLRGISIKNYGGVSSFEVIDSRIIVFFMLQFENPKNDWIVLDTIGNLIAEKKRQIPEFYSMGLLHGTYKFNNSVTYWNPFTDTVFSVLPDLTYKASFLLSPGEHRFPKRRLTSYESSEQYLKFKQIFETNRFLIFQYSYKKKHILEMSDKKDSRSIRYFLEVADDGPPTIFSGGILNDLDNGNRFQPGGTTYHQESYFVENDNEYIVGLTQSNKIKTRVESSDFKTSKPKYPEKKKELEKLANSLKETDNPVLMMVRLKK